MLGYYLLGLFTPILLPLAYFSVRFLIDYVWSIVAKLSLYFLLHKHYKLASINDGDEYLPWTMYKGYTDDSGPDKPKLKKYEKMRLFDIFKLPTIKFSGKIQSLYNLNRDKEWFYRRKWVFFHKLIEVKNK